MKIVIKDCTNPWQKNGFLWKPVAENVGKPCVVTLPRGKVQSVIVLDENKKKIKTLRFRSTGDAGDAWQDYYETADKYPKPIWVRVMRSKILAWDFFIKNPKRRSDGKKGEGNWRP